MELPESVVKMHKMLNPLGHLGVGVAPVGGGGSAGGGLPPVLPLTGLVLPFPNPGDRRMSRYGHTCTCMYDSKPFQYTCTCKSLHVVLMYI